jgi:hypothetical protein
MRAQSKEKYTLGEYFAIEREHKEKFEYWNGSV